jgi:hypothetical protein
MDDDRGDVQEHTVHLDNRRCVFEPVQGAIDEWPIPKRDSVSKPVIAGERQRIPVAVLVYEII